MNILQKISLINKIGKAWKESKKIIDNSKPITEEARQIGLELIALLERTKNLLPPAKNVIESIIGIIKNALG